MSVGKIFNLDKLFALVHFFGGWVGGGAIFPAISKPEQNSIGGYAVGVCLRKMR